MRSRCWGSGGADLSRYGLPVDSTRKTNRSGLCATAITAGARLPLGLVVTLQNSSFRTQFFFLEAPWVHSVSALRNHGLPWLVWLLLSALRLLPGPIFDRH